MLKQGMKRTHYEARYDETLETLAGLRAASSHQIGSQGWPASRLWLDGSTNEMLRGWPVGAPCIPVSLHGDGAPLHRGAPDEMSDDDGAKGWHDMTEKDVALEEVIKAKRSLLEMHLVLQPSPPDIPPPI